LDQWKSPPGKPKSEKKESRTPQLKIFQKRKKGRGPTTTEKRYEEDDGTREKMKKSLFRSRKKKIDSQDKWGEWTKKI